MSAPSSPASEDSMKGSDEQAGSTPSSARAAAIRTVRNKSALNTPKADTGARCSPPVSQEYRSTRTYRRSTSPHGPEGSGLETERWEPDRVADPLMGADMSYPARVLISSAEDSPARTSPSPGDEQDSWATDPASSLSSPESLSLFDPAGCSSRTFQVSSLHKAVGTSDACLERWPSSGMAWPGGFSTAATSECRSDVGGCSSSEPSLTVILEPLQSVPEKYSLSARAARGILRRAEKRGRTLPPHLARALAATADGMPTQIGQP